jgi:hypothetical protein
MDRNPLRGEALYRDVAAYDALGEHRSASTTDNRTAEWIATELRQSGCEVAFQTFPAACFEAETIRLCPGGGEAMEIFPQWPVNLTGPQGISGRLAQWDASPNRANADSVTGAIAVTRLGAGEHPCVAGAAIRAAAGAGARGVLVITESPTGEIVAFNAPFDMPPWPVPAALIGQKHEKLLEAGIKSGRRATLIIDGDSTLQATARNVIGRQDRGAAKWVVILTPHSGWFHCAGERGPGVALLLGLARWTAARDLPANFLFVSASGHELGMIGENTFIDEAAPSPDKVAFWLHLGASIGTHNPPAGSVGHLLYQPNHLDHDIATHAELLPAVRKHMAACPGYSNPEEIDAYLGKVHRARRRDEALYGKDLSHDERDYLAYHRAMHAGYRPLLMLAGDHAYFHTPADRPHTTNAELLEPIGTALANIMSEVLKSNDTP